MSTGDTGGWSLVPNWVMRAPGLGPHAKLLYPLLWSHGAGPAGDASPSRKTLASELGVSVDTVDRAVRELVGFGALVVERRRDAAGQGTNVYRLLHVPGPSPRTEARR